MSGEAKAARRGLRLRGLAWALHSLNRSYEARVADRKRALFAPLAGTVAEIGPGTGPNFACLPAGIRWIGVEPNLHMHPYLERAARERGLEVEIRTGVAETLPFEDASLDGVVSSLVLCSVSDVEAVLREIRRVLKPGGRYVFVEHVAAPRGTWLRRMQRLSRPISRWLADGCEADRETWRFIETAGFASVVIEHARVPLDIASPHIFGTAVA